MHTDIDHDSIPSPVSVYTRICIYIYICTKGRTMHVSNLIKPGSFENQSLPAPSSSFSEYSAEHPVISRRIEVERRKNAKFLHASCRAPPRLTSNLPTYLPSPPLALPPRRTREDPFDLFAGTFISATGHRLPPLICKYSLTVIKDTGGRFARIAARILRR